MLVAVLSVTKYDFKPDNGNQLKGAKVTYLGEMEATEDVKGMRTMTVNAPFEMFYQMPVVPGYYEVDFSQRPDGKGKPVLTVTKADYLGECQIGILEKAAK
jgi:hypothetical protein